MRALLAAGIVLIGSVVSAAEIKIGALPWRPMDEFVPGAFVYVPSEGQHYLYRAASEELWHVTRGGATVRLQGSNGTYQHAGQTILIRR